MHHILSIKNRDTKQVLCLGMLTSVWHRCHESSWILADSLQNRFVYALHSLILNIQNCVQSPRLWMSELSSWGKPFQEKTNSFLSFCHVFIPVWNILCRCSRHYIPLDSPQWSVTGWCCLSLISHKEHQWQWPCGVFPVFLSVLPPVNGFQRCILNRPNVCHIAVNVIL